MARAIFLIAAAWMAFASWYFFFRNGIWIGGVLLSAAALLFLYRGLSRRR